MNGLCELAKSIYNFDLLEHQQKQSKLKNSKY